jgi:hypothetical protein
VAQLFSLGGIAFMDSKRQEAYRHLLYTVLLRLRSGHRDVVWWSPASWRRTALEFRLNKQIADCFHNLAFFSAHNFEHFDEARFWQDVEHLGQTCGRDFVESYHRIFDEYVAGRAAYTC